MKFYTALFYLGFSLFTPKVSAQNIIVYKGVTITSDSSVINSIKKRSDYYNMTLDYLKDEEIESLFNQSKYNIDALDSLFDITDYLKTVYLVKNIQVNQGSIGGTYDTAQKAIYLKKPRSDWYFDLTFFHEFSSLFLYHPKNNYRLNVGEFWNLRPKYYDNEMGISVKDITLPYYSTIPDERSIHKGYICSYAQVSFEEDFNCSFAILFLDGRRYKKSEQNPSRINFSYLVEKYDTTTIVSQKMALIQKMLKICQKNFSGDSNERYPHSVFTKHFVYSPNKYKH